CADRVLRVSGSGLELALIGAVRVSPHGAPRNCHPGVGACLASANAVAVGDAIAERGGAPTTRGLQDSAARPRRYLGIDRRTPRRSKSHWWCIAPAGAPPSRVPALRSAASSQRLPLVGNKPPRCGNAAP